MCQISFSVVSHCQGELVKKLLDDILNLQLSDIEVIVTLNTPEHDAIYSGYPFPVRLIKNQNPRGFGANHNAAFKISKGEFFSVINPDIRLKSLDVGQLKSPFNNASVAVVAPLVENEACKVEDSFRQFPSVGQIIKRVFFNQRKTDYKVDKYPFDVDWVAGMFMVFRPQAFQDVGGFDEERFYMYLEDADICKRLWSRGWRVILNPAVIVIHSAQRASHKSFRHLRWHVSSMFRYWAGI